MLKFTDDHEWLRIDGDTAVVGITNYAQEQLGDLVFVELPSAGTNFKKGAAAAVVWTGRQTWDWTQHMTLPKTAVCFALGWLALVVLATQEYNPFIYFIF